MKSCAKSLSMRGVVAGLVLALGVGALGGSRAFGADSSWTEDYAAAAKRAAKEHKMLLLDFTGSDWCPYCIQLTNKVLSTPEFKKWAADKFVLVELDYPQQKEQSADIKKQNAAMQEKYSISGFPTVIILDSSEKEVTRAVGYGGDKPADWIKARDEEIAKAQGK